MESILFVEMSFSDRSLNGPAGQTAVISNSDQTSMISTLNIVIKSQASLKGYLSISAKSVSFEKEIDRAYLKGVFPSSELEALPQDFVIINETDTFYAYEKLEEI
jgi:hypothetical protein